MPEISHVDLAISASSKLTRKRLLIDGQQVEPLSGRYFDVLNPATGEIIAVVAEADASDIDRAVRAARRALEGPWGRMRAADRGLVLQRFAQLLEDHAQELIALESLDPGKPLAAVQRQDLPAAIDTLRYYAGWADKINGQVIPARHDALTYTVREPIGVVGAIVPWNFPLMMACWKLGPALSTGNSVILKPSEKSPLTAIRIAALAVEAGIPKGVLNVLPGYGHTVGKALALHNDVDTLVFTGSTKIAKQLLIYSGESNMKRVWLEAGGKSPNIVFADAPDLQAAAESAAGAIAFNQGEVCTAGSRLLVERSIKDKFLPLVIEALKTWKPGNPLDPATNVGALVDTQQMNTVLSYIESGHADGAKLVAGGKRTLQETGGTYVEPTIFDGVSNAMKIAQEEIFGPVLSVIAFDTAEEAVAIANDTPYGLAAAVWTKDISKAHLTARALRAGSVWVNQYDGGDMTAPFGGFKQSGNGRDKSLHAFDKYTELKATWIKL
jgi:4-guanidinobutyraldehyde dehydrogenase/NAD-dependent aldehyde dehydrogenase